MGGPSKSGTRYCAAHGCNNNKKRNPNLTFFVVPKDRNDPDRWKRWIQYSRRADLMDKSFEYCNKYIAFCPIHFERSQFMNDKRNKLIFNAVPTLFDVPNQPPPATISRPLPNRRVSKPPKNKREKRRP